VAIGPAYSVRLGKLFPVKIRRSTCDDLASIAGLSTASVHGTVSRSHSQERLIAWTRNIKRELLGCAHLTAFFFAAGPESSYSYSMVYPLNPGLPITRRVIAAILILTVLGYGTAWAFDWHAMDAAEHIHASEHADTDSHADDGCDHCCHAGVHLLGFSRPVHDISSSVSDSHLKDDGVIFVSRSTDPLLKPPQT
jgi:hypothetical protein